MLKDKNLHYEMKKIFCENSFFMKRQKLFFL